MCNIKVSVNFIKCSELVTEVAALTIHAELLAMKLSTVLRLVFFTLVHHFTLIIIHRKANFFNRVCVIAVFSVVTVTIMSDVFAQFGLH